LVAYAGSREIYGFNGLVNGPLEWKDSGQKLGLDHIKSGDRHLLLLTGELSHGP
jgi:hypothetical protein